MNVWNLFDRGFKRKFEYSIEQKKLSAWSTKIVYNAIILPFF